MSSTRIAEPGSPFRQERYASSYDRGLLGNLVAKRVAVLEAGSDLRGLIWFVQWLSWQPGGLSAVPVPEVCRWCLDPHSSLAAADLEALWAFRAAWLKARSDNGYVETAVGKCVAEALDYTRSARTISIIDGPSRIGKTFAVKRWIEQSAGLARFAQVPSTSDEQSFLRAIATALGVSINLNSKAVELRNRVEETLQGGDLMLVLDEASYLYSQTWQRYAQPARVNWIMTALANYAVPVALVSCPHFYTNQTRTEKLTGWNSTQFIGRIGHVERLPKRLSNSDLLAVARAIFPAGDQRTLVTLASYAAVSDKHLASIEAVVKRARWLAARKGRAQATVADVETALRECVIPGDAALVVSLRPSKRMAREACAELSPEPRARFAEDFSISENQVRELETETLSRVRT